MAPYPQITQITQIDVGTVTPEKSAKICEICGKKPKPGASDVERAQTPRQTVPSPFPGKIRQNPPEVRKSEITMGGRATRLAGRVAPKSQT